MTTCLGVNFTNILWAAFVPKSFWQKITNPNCKHLKAVQRTLVWLSISPIFYKQLFHTKVLRAPFICSKFGFVIFWQKDFGAKAAHKMLVILTLGHLGRCHRDSIISICLARPQGAQGKYNSNCRQYKHGLSLLTYQLSQLSLLVIVTLVY